jgi:hypothetical protein
MDKATARIIYECPDDKLISLWKQLNIEDYLDLRKTNTDIEIVKMVKRMVKDVLDDKVTSFEIVDEKGNRYVHMEYLGEIEKEEKECLGERENGKTDRKGT